MTVVLIGSDTDNIKGAIKSTGMAVNHHTATDYTGHYSLTSYDPVPDQPFILDEKYGKSYKPIWGVQGLLYRYDPKVKHDQIKPMIGYKAKRFNRKSFPKTRMNFR